jgi:hypothetical protein
MKVTIKKTRSSSMQNFKSLNYESSEEQTKRLLRKQCDTGHTQTRQAV